MVARHNYVQITGYFTQRDGAQWKGRMERLRRVEHRLSESRIVEEALKVYVPILEAQVLPTHDAAPTRRRQRTIGE